MPERRARRARPLVRPRSEPKRVTVPEVGGMRPSATRAAVDFPEPDSPTRPRVSPGPTWSETPSRARTAALPRPKTTLMSVSSATGAGAFGGACGAGRLVPYRLRLPLSGLGPLLGHRFGDGEPGHGGEEPPRVVVAGAQQDVLDGARLDDLAPVHDRDAVDEVGDDAHVVGHEQYAGAGVDGEAAQEVEDLGLHGDVERGGRLVGDQQARLVGDGHGDDDALALAAGELEGVGAGAVLRVGDADAAQEFDGLGGGLLRGDLAVVADHLADLAADPGERVERGGGFLEHHRDALAAQRGERGVRGADDLGTGDDGAAGGAGVGVEEAHRGERDGRLAGAGLADEGEGLAGGDLEGHALDGRYLAGLGGEDDAEVVECEYGSRRGASGSLGGGAHPRPLTSKASRSPSPIALNAHTTTMMARPGGRISHQ